MTRVITSYPRVYLDIEVYRPPTRRGRAGFFSRKSRLVCYAVAVEREPGDVEYIVEASGDEKRLLRGLAAAVAKVRGQRSRSVPLIGYNVLGYDIPFIVYRAGLHMDPGAVHRLIDDLYRGFIHVDLFQWALMVYRGEGLPGFMDFLRQVYCLRGRGVPVKETGYNVHGYVEEGRYDLVERYSRSEMEMLVELYNLLTVPGAVEKKCLDPSWSLLGGLLGGEG